MIESTEWLFNILYNITNSYAKYPQYTKCCKKEIFGEKQVLEFDSYLNCVCIAEKEVTSGY